MKKFSVKQTVPALAVLVAVLIIGSGCPGGGSSPTPPPATITCDTTNSPFKQMYQSLITTTVPAWQDLTSIDNKTHEYSFTVNTNRNICAIGYQAQPVITAASLPYTMQIVNATSGTILYTGNHVFGSSTTTYVPVTPLALTAGQPYIIRRTLNNFLGNVLNTISRYAKKPATGLSFPMSQGTGFSILSSAAYDAPSGSVSNNHGVPYIDIIFQ
jgi:hypothetical protein